MQDGHTLTDRVVWNPYWTTVVAT